MTFQILCFESNGINISKSYEKNMEALRLSDLLTILQLIGNEAKTRTQNQSFSHCTTQPVWYKTNICSIQYQLILPLFLSPQICSHNDVKQCYRLHFRYYYHIRPEIKFENWQLLIIFQPQKNKGIYVAIFIFGTLPHSTIPGIQ